MSTDSCTDLAFEETCMLGELILGIIVLYLLVLGVKRAGAFRNSVTKIRQVIANVAAVCVKLIGESDYDVFNKRELERECAGSEAWIQVQAILERFRAGTVNFVKDCTTAAHTRIVNACGECTDGCTDSGQCGVCVDFKQELEATFGCRIQNADVSELRKNPWEVCKLCLPPAHADKERIEDVDCIELLELMSNCKVVCDQFSSSIEEYRQKIVDMIRDNKWDKSTVRELVTCTVIVLDDIPGSEQAIDDIKKVQTNVSIKGFDIRKSFRVAIFKIAELQNHCCVQQEAIDVLNNQTTRNKETIKKVQKENKQHQKVINKLRDKNVSQGTMTVKQCHRISRQRNSLRELKSEMNRNKIRIYQLQDEKCRQERKVVELHEQVNELNRNIDGIKAENKQRHNMNMKGQEMKNKLLSEINGKQDIIDKLRVTIDKLEEEEERYQDKIYELTDERNNKQTIIDKMKIDLKQNQEEKERLGNDVNNMQQEDEVKRAMIEKSKETVKNMKEEDRIKQETINKLEETLDKLKEETRLEKDILEETLEKLKEEYQIQIDEWKNTFDTLETEDKMKQEQIDVLEKSLDKLKEENRLKINELEHNLETLKQNDNVKQENIHELEKALDKMKDEYQKNIDELENTIKTLKINGEVKQNQIDALQETLDKLKEETRLEKDILEETLDKLKEEYQIQIDEWKNTFDTLETEDKMKQEQIDVLEKSLDKLKEEDRLKINELEHNLETLKQNDNVKQENIHELEKALDKMKDEYQKNIDELENTIKTLKINGEVKQNQIDALQETLDKLNEENKIKIHELQKTLEKVMEEDKRKQEQIVDLGKQNQRQQEWIEELEKRQKNIEMKDEVQKLEQVIKQLQQQAKDGYIDESALGKPETGYWLKGQLILRKFREGVAPFVDTCASDFHKDQYSSSSDGQCIPTCSRRRRCATCDQMKRKLEQISNWTGGRGYITLENTLDPSKRWLTPLALLKCYMPSGYDQQESIDDIDSAGMLAVMNNCPYIFDMFSKNITGGQTANTLIDMTEIRNNLMHSPQLECEQPDLDKLVKHSVTVLEDKPLKHTSYSEEAVRGIKQIQQSSTFKVETILSLLNDCRSEIVKQEQCIQYKDDYIAEQKNDNEEDIKQLKLDHTTRCDEMQKKIIELQNEHRTKCIPNMNLLKEEHKKLKEEHEAKCVSKIASLEVENDQLKSEHETKCIPLKIEHETKCISMITQLKDENDKLKI